MEVTVQKRNERGTARARRMRNAGKLPAILYGGGGESVSLTLQAEDVFKAIREGDRIFDLRGELNEKAIIREFQWDPFGAEVLHVDLVRVKAGEKIEVTVAVELRGDAPGSREGGVLNQHIHEVDIQTIPSAIPEKLQVNINELQMGETLSVAAIEDLPEEATLLTDPETILVECMFPIEEPEEEEAEAAAPEPEVIGRPEDEEEGESS